MTRLDTLVIGEPGTTHYTKIYHSWMATVTTVMLPIDSDAARVLSPEEWSSRLATMPVEFIRSINIP